jgi:hypothetical protein
MKRHLCGFLLTARLSAYQTDSVSSTRCLRIPPSPVCVSTDTPQITQECNTRHSLWSECYLLKRKTELVVIGLHLNQ